MISPVRSGMRMLCPVVNARVVCLRFLTLPAAFFATTSLLSAGTFTAFGPKSYTRSAGAPVTITDTFSVLNPKAQYTLKAFNGGMQNSQAELVSSSVIILNGMQVLGPNNFNQNVTEVDVPVTLLASNTLSVQVRGQPGSVLAVEIVGVDNVLPTIKAAVSPTPNAAGWNNTNVAVTFTCTDATSAVTCPASQTVSAEGSSQVVSGTAQDAAGNTATASVTLNIDKTPPTITIISPANGATFSTLSAAVSGAVSDSLSGISTVFCNSAPGAVQNGSFTCSVPLTQGANTITTQATDVAGNASSSSISVILSSGPSITSFTPLSGPVGSIVALSGSHFTVSAGSPPQVTLNQQGGGTIAAPVSAFSDATLSFVVPDGAATGPVTVA